MLLTDSQKHEYEEKGFLLLEDVFSSADVETIRTEFSSLALKDIPGKVLEKDDSTVRGIHGPHFHSPVFHNVVRHTSLLEPAMQLLDSQVYIHQFKINVKAACAGDVWPWHQDFQYWHDEDGMETPQVISVALFLDDVTEFNGPLTFVPGSHKVGMINTMGDEKAGVGWQASVTAKLKYTLDQETIAQLVREGGLVAPKGKKGSLLLFHPNIAHASTTNIAPYDRILCIITYNSIYNKLIEVPNPRPAFMAYRSYEPLTPLANNALV